MTARAAAVSLGCAVLGAGLILMPPIAFGLAGRYAVAAWLAHIAAGVTVAVVTGLLGRGTGAGNIAEVTGRALGSWAEKAILVCYLAGFTVGQAVLAMTGARLAISGLTHASPQVVSAAAGPAAAGFIAAATGAAVAGVRFGDRARSGRLLATLVLAAAGCAWPALYRSSGLLSAPAGFTAGSVIFLLFFAGVGWEAMSRFGPSLPDRRSLVWAVFAGGAAVAAVYLALAVLLAARTEAAAPSAWLGAGIGVGAAVLLLLYCTGNVAAAAGFLAALRGYPRPTHQATAVGAGAAIIAILASQAAISPQALLVVPCCAAWIGYLLATAAAARSRVISRGAALAVFVVLLAVPLAALA